MAQTRHLTIDITQIPHIVAYEITFETDPASPDYETIHADPAKHVIIASDVGDVGWTWSEEEGLKEPPGTEAAGNGDVASTGLEVDATDH